MTHTEKAAELHLSGYNCAQAVAAAFADVTDLSEEELERLSMAFGAGGGCMEGICGAVAAAQLIAGLTSKSKAEASKKAREILTKFKEQNGSLICKELKGIETGKVLRPCHDCVIDAAEFLEEALKEK